LPVSGWYRSYISGKSKINNGSFLTTDRAGTEPGKLDHDTDFLLDRRLGSPRISKRRHSEICGERQNPLSVRIVVAWIHFVNSHKAVRKLI
jgi:hypothetical protein